MYYHTVILTVLCTTAYCANYQRYNDDGKYSTYSPYTTVANIFNGQYKTNYGSDISNFPEVTRYPNYNPSYTTAKYNSYTTPKTSFYVPDSTTKYGQAYGANYGNAYGKSYSQGYGRGGYSSYEAPFMGDVRDYCMNRSPQGQIWVDNLMGMWYGVEYIQHLAGDSRVDYTQSCIVVHISEPMDKPSTENQLFHVQHINARFRQEYRHLRLLWDEGGHTSEYSLYFRNDSAGYWQVFDAQNGTLPAQSNYQQFSGTIQVLKAVHDHLVLNFCQEANINRPAQLYSLLLSRDPGTMKLWEIESVHTLLQTKKLSVASRRMVCGNSAVKHIYSFISTALLLLLTYVVSS